MKKVKVKSESESELCLNKDIIFDILSRIEVKHLFRMKRVSKDWKQIISSRSFMKAQLKNANLVLNGFIVQDRYMLCKHDIKTVSYIPVETRNGGKVVHQTVFTFLPEQVVVLASSKGIICCRSCLPSPNPTRLYLCNPCNRDWIQLDWPPQCDITDSIALAFDFECEFELSKFKFKLVRVKRNEEDESFSFTFDLYSLATKDWRKSTEICYCNSDLIKNKGIYIGVPSVEFRSVPEAYTPHSTRFRLCLCK
uniref:Uncharacterized protein LOC105852025 n=1 Tax=Cicer arietinum TaxID=3827 RepID=A0A1S3E4Z0_CICAR|nr:uncharacterized protein LOC105852025 [Cicer arietinum]